MRAGGLDLQSVDAVQTLPPTLLGRYISAAERISRLAVGRQGNSPDGYALRMSLDLTQNQHVGGLPIGPPGGSVLHLVARVGR